MQRCVLFSSDARLISQVRTWAKPIDQTIRLDVFNSFKDFHEYRSNDVEGHRSEYFEKDIADGPEGMLIRLLIVDVEMLSDKPLDELRDLRKTVAELGLVSALAPPRLMVLGFEAGHLKPEVFQNEFVDDLVFKPLDRQLFLQKVEFLASDDLYVKPTFLFNAETEMTVEVGKDVIVDEVSEFGLAIRNPTALNEGLFAAIHCDALGSVREARVIGRVYKSTPHPVRKNEFLVHFSYFGLTAGQLSHVRHFVKTQQDLHRSGKHGPAKKTDPLLIAPPEKVFAVIDMNPASLEQTMGLLEGGFKNAVIRPFASFSQLHAELLRFVEASNAPVSVNPGEEAPAALPGGEKIYFTIKAHSAEIVNIEPPPSPEASLLGKKAREFTERPALWFSLIEKEDKGRVTEFINAAERGVSARSTFRMRDAQGLLIYLEVSAFLARSGVDPEIRLELKQIPHAKFQELNGEGAAAPARDPKFYRFDAVVIDAALVRPTPEVWIEEFGTLLRKARILDEKDPLPKILVVADDQPWFRPDLFRVPRYHDFSFKPLEKRFVTLKIQALLPDLRLHREPDVPAKTAVEIHAKIAKDVKLSALAEYGLEIEQKGSFREGVLMRFYSELFGENGGWVAARCRFSKKVEKSEIHHSRFIFFGVSDEVFQRIRRWIREDYVHKKEGA